VWVGNWVAITIQGLLGLGKKTVNVDLDLSCVMYDGTGKLCDYLYSPLYRKEFLSQYSLPPGKLDKLNSALHYVGDDRSGDSDGDDGLDNEIITVDLQQINLNVRQIFFFLNNCGKEDFSQIPYASIRMFEGKPDRVGKVFAAYNVSADSTYKGMTALVMGEIYKENGTWKFNAIGYDYSHPNLVVTIQLISKQYIRR